MMAHTDVHIAVHARPYELWRLWGALGKRQTLNPKRNPAVHWEHKHSWQA